LPDKALESLQPSKTFRITLHERLPNGSVIVEEKDEGIHVTIHRGESKVSEIVSPAMCSVTSLRWARSLTTPPQSDAAQPLRARVATAW
jgi:hypothetical protein